MLDAGFRILDLKGIYPYFIQHQVSSILPTMAQTFVSKIPYGAVRGGLISNLVPECPD